MEQCQPYSCCRRREDPPEFNLRDWDLKASRISRQNTNSRRFSASNITSFREDVTRSSFRSNITMSSTASSPGYPFNKDEIDPSTYSFTTALRALQAKSGYNNNWECLSPEGFALHSKWNDAEKYISNPLSGQVPMECLSARSFRNLQNRTTMSGPLVYSSHSRPTQPKPASFVVRESELLQIPIPEKKAAGMTRDVGIQIGTPTASSLSSSPSPTSTPSIQDRMPKWYGTEAGESSNSSFKPKSEEEVEVLKEEEEGEREDGEEEEEESSKRAEQRESEKESSDSESEQQQIRRCRQAAGCLSWMIKRHEREKQKISRQPTTRRNSFFISCTSVKRSYS